MCLRELDKICFRRVPSSSYCSDGCQERMAAQDLLIPEGWSRAYLVKSPSHLVKMLPACAQIILRAGSVLTEEDSMTVISCLSFTPQDKEGVHLALENRWTKVKKTKL